MTPLDQTDAPNGEPTASIQAPLASVIRDRLKSDTVVRRKASDLLPNPKNYRLHPESQRSALEGVLRQVGIADVILCRETPEGLQIIDGHLRQDLDPDVEWPCLVLDVDDTEADFILATHDPLTGMATIDSAMLDELLKGVQAESWALNQMLEDLAKESRTTLDSISSEPDTTYTNKIVSPVYEPKGERPPLSALIDRGKTQELMTGIDAADIPEDVKEFLRFAAERHTVFNFRQIAEFYCHADATLQNLMERSGLVIIDFDKAIEYGFVHLTERLGALADMEEADANA